MEQETAADAGAAGTTTEARTMIVAINNPRRGSHRLMFMPRSPFLAADVRSG